MKQNISFLVTSIFLLVGCSSSHLPSTPTVPPLGIGSTMISSKDSMKLLYVAAGKFTMGNETYDEEKIHMVYLDAFWVDQYEVTNK